MNVSAWNSAKVRPPREAMVEDVLERLPWEVLAEAHAVREIVQKRKVLEASGGASTTFWLRVRRVAQLQLSAT